VSDPAAPRVALVLDFDGVICDSVDECFASSWTAFHQLFMNRAPGGAQGEARAAFARMRPFVRSGHDFVLIQQMVDRGLQVDSQAGFDDAAHRAGPDTLRRFEELFYEARASLLLTDRDAWIRMNRIYPHVAVGIAGLSRGAPLYILSTKRPQFIAEILDANGITVPPGSILLSSGEPKLRSVDRLRAQGRYEQAVFVEDQIDAIKGNADPRIKAYLATWGYVQAEWLRAPAVVELLNPETFLELLARTWPRQ
jgi:phosphoglycolate phosphatase-like HAD superfamily hydrolase